MRSSSSPPSAADYDLAYRRWRARPLGQITDALEQRLLFALLGDLAGLSVLDLGCGDGRLALALARRGAAVLGADAAPSRLAQAAEAARREGLAVRFLAADATALPLAQACCDRVVMVATLCFVAEPLPVFAEIARVLRPGGRLVLGELGPASLWTLHRRLRGLCGDPLWQSAHFRSNATLAHLAQAAGLVVRAQRAAIFYPPWDVAARLLAPLDPLLARLVPAAGAFQVLAAERPLDAAFP